jgi:asparagine synthetase B (glutamine-hydrolysing)
VLNKRKQGFSIPMDLWLWQPGEWRDMVNDTIFSRRTAERDQFDMRELERLRVQHDRLERLNGYKLWTVFMFEMWQREFLDGRA